LPETLPKKTIKKKKKEEDEAHVERQSMASKSPTLLKACHPQKRLKGNLKREECCEKGYQESFMSIISTMLAFQHAMPGGKGGKGGTPEKDGEAQPSQNTSFLAQSRYKLTQMTRRGKKKKEGKHAKGEGGRRGKKKGGGGSLKSQSHLPYILIGNEKRGGKRGEAVGIGSPL